MAAYLFAVFLGVLTIAASAAGLAIPEYAVAWWILAAVLGFATVAVALFEWRHRNRPTPSSGVSTKGSNSPAISQSGSHNTITLGEARSAIASSPDPVELLRAARGPLRDAIAAFADKAAFDRDPLRFQRHEFGESTAEIRKVIQNYWHAREPELDKALANVPPRNEYEWRRASLKRLDALVGLILSDGAGLAGFDRLIDRRMLEGDALRERLGQKATAQYVNDLTRDIRRWQERCVRTVERCAVDRAAVFKANAGPYQPRFGDPVMIAKAKDWRTPARIGLDRWLDALRDVHS